TSVTDSSPPAPNERPPGICVPATRLREVACRRSRSSDSERLTAILADVDARRCEGAVRLLGGRLDAEGRASLEVVLAADFIAHDVCVRGYDNSLVAFLVLHDEGRLTASAHCRDCAGGLDRAVCHGAVGCAVPARTMAIA